jgi:dihydroneopterin triphosphate diphosphatase
MPAARDFKRPESVLVVIHTHALECLLLERAQPRGFWQSVTGSLRWGETAAECAAREVREETGLDPSAVRDAGVQRSFPILPEWRRRYSADVTSNLEHLWYLAVPSVRPVALQPAEHVQHAWLPIAAAIEQVSSWTNREALERLRDAGGAA